MAKTKKSTAKTAARKTKAAKETPVASTVPVASTPTTKATKKEKPARTRDPRLPATGTVIQKLGRLGDVRCECTVLEDGGIEYKGTRYKSLSAAAKAAATDLNLASKAQNGWAFWGIVKPAHRGADPVESLKKAWERYCERATGLIAGEFNEVKRTKLVDLLNDHAAALTKMAGQLQATAV